MDEAFMIMRDFASDSSSAKVDLGAGVYRDGNERPFVLPSVQKVSLTYCNFLAQVIMQILSYSLLPYSCQLGSNNHVIGRAAHCKQPRHEP
jgi:hypothetical protein